MRKIFYILCVGILAMPMLNSCTSQSRGFNYSAHAKKNKKLKSNYRGNLTKYNCRKR